MNQLTKSSSSKEIKAYFNAVLKLSQSDDEFPINLDEVWPLVYSRRQEAVRALTSNEQFIESVDYQTVRKDAQQDYKTLARNGKQDEASWGGNNKIDYKLTVSCMEFFIARKVRPVFEVYRKVFHKVSEVRKKLTGPTPTKVKASIEWVKGMKELLNLNDSSVLSLVSQVAEPLGLPTPDYTPSKGILKSAGKLLKENEYPISAQTFNQMMIDKGYMVELTRSSSRGRVKKFKSITGEGLNYGENQVNPNNPKSTQPLYYEDKFVDLLTILQE